jgi:hypothetical protein
MDGLGHFHPAAILAGESDVVVRKNQGLHDHVLDNVAGLVLVCAAVQAVAGVKQVVDAADLLVAGANLRDAC